MDRQRIVCIANGKRITIPDVSAVKLEINTLYEGRIRPLSANISLDEEQIKAIRSVLGRKRHEPV